MLLLRRCAPCLEASAKSKEAGTSASPYVRFASTTAAWRSSRLRHSAGAAARSGASCAELSPSVGVRGHRPWSPARPPTTGPARMPTREHAGTRRRGRKRHCDWRTRSRGQQRPQPLLPACPYGIGRQPDEFDTEFDIHNEREGRTPRSCGSTKASPEPGGAAEQRWHPDPWHSSRQRVAGSWPAPSPRLNEALEFCCMRAWECCWTLRGAYGGGRSGGVVGCVGHLVRQKYMSTFYGPRLKVFFSVALRPAVDGRQPLMPGPRRSRP